MGLLSDVYSYGDTLKRKINDLAKNPGAALEQFIGQLGDDTNRTLSLEDQAGWGLGNRPFVSVLADTRPSIGFDGKIGAVTSQQRDSARFQLGEQGANSGMAAPIQKFHSNVLSAYSKGIPDNVVADSFGAEGYVYHTPYRPFENAQQSAIGEKANVLSERLFSTQSPLSAKMLDSIEAVPVSGNASYAFSKELGDEGAMGFFNKDGKRFSVVLPSAKNQGQYQATQYDPRGAIGDSQHQSQAEAIQRMIDGGYSRIIDENRIDGLLTKVMLGK